MKTKHWWAAGGVLVGVVFGTTIRSWLGKAGL